MKPWPVCWAAAEQVVDDPVVYVPRDIIMVGRALGTLGGMFFNHRPSFDMGGVLLPILIEGIDAGERRIA